MDASEQFVYPFTCPFPCGYQGSAQFGAGSRRCRSCCVSQIARGEPVTSLQCVCACVCVRARRNLLHPSYARLPARARRDRHPSTRRWALSAACAAEGQLHVVRSLGNRVWASAALPPVCSRVMPRSGMRKRVRYGNGNIRKSHPRCSTYTTPLLLWSSHFPLSSRGPPPL